MSKEQLETALKTIQAFSGNSYMTGAKYLASCAKTDLSDDFFNKLYHNLSVVENSNELIEAIKTVRASCSNNPKAQQYTQQQAENMAQIQATTDYLNNKNKSGCSLM